MAWLIRGLSDRVLLGLGLAKDSLAQINTKQHRNIVTYLYFVVYASELHI